MSSNLNEYEVSAADGSRSGIKIKAKTRQEAAEIFKQKTGKEAAHIAGNPYLD